MGWGMGMGMFICLFVYNSTQPYLEMVSGISGWVVANTNGCFCRFLIDETAAFQFVGFGAGVGNLHVVGNQYKGKIP